MLNKLIGLCGYLVIWLYGNLSSFGI